MKEEEEEEEEGEEEEEEEMDFYNRLSIGRCYERPRVSNLR
jgi:hypothetical protein